MNDQMLTTCNIVVTAIPLTLAIRSQISVKQKWALVAVFSLALIITIISIVRFVLSNPNNSVIGPSWLGVWSVVEQAVSVIIVSCTSFRSLLLQRARSSKSSSERNRHNIFNTVAVRKKETPMNTSGRLPLHSHGVDSLELDEVGDLELNHTVFTKDAQEMPATTAADHQTLLR